MTSRKRETLARREIEPFDARAARVAALAALARRDYACEDLRRKLLDKGYDRGLVGELLSRLCTEKLVDDRRYVENFVSLHAARGQGPQRIRAELQKIGLQGDLVEHALGAFDDWLAVLRHAREKKFGGRLPTHYADKQRQARFLGYRGFTAAHIRLVLGFDMDRDADT